MTKKNLYHRINKKTHIWMKMINKISHINNKISHINLK